MPVVLVVDDSAPNREMIRIYLSTIDVDVQQAGDGVTALEMIEAQAPDLVLLDVRMPRMDGYEVCRRIKAMPRGRLLPVVMITGLSQTTHRVMALEAGADDFMAKPVEGAELIARVRSALRLKELYNTLDSAEHVIFSLATAVEAKDSFTERHTHRVGESARLLGQKLGLSEPTLDTLYRGGIIHDIGKIGVSDSILHKPGPLNAIELPQMQAHVEIGESIVRPLHSTSGLLPIIRHHHERFDGSGYPDGLRAREIPRVARIVSVCDAFDALVNDRPYRSRRSTVGPGDGRPPGHGAADVAPPRRCLVVVLPPFQGEVPAKPAEGLPGVLQAGRDPVDAELKHPLGPLAVGARSPAVAQRAQRTQLEVRERVDVRIAELDRP